MHLVSSPSTTSSRHHKSAGLLPIQDTKTRQVITPQVTRTGKTGLMQCTGTASGWKSLPEYRPGLPLKKKMNTSKDLVFCLKSRDAHVLHVCQSGLEGAKWRDVQRALLAGWLERGIARLEGYIPCMQTLLRMCMLQIASILVQTCVCMYSTYGKLGYVKAISGEPLNLHTSIGSLHTLYCKITSPHSVFTAGAQTVAHSKYLR